MWRFYCGSGLALLLAGCGGGGESTPCAPKTLQLFGDSTQMLAAPYWQARYQGTISNAVGGTNSVQLRAGTDGLNKPWPQSVVGQVVVIKHGTNDGTAAYGKTPIETYKDNLRFFAANARARVVFETPDPATDPERSTSVPPYTQAMREVAAELQVTLIDTDVCWRNNPQWQSFLTDGTHANAAGLKFTVEQCVAPVMDAMECK